MTFLAAPAHSFRSRQTILAAIDLNPIEHDFAKLKHLLRKAVDRTVEYGLRGIGSG
ncbi:hypothetical protein [Bradyrhizobium sp. CCBAU 11445]|uniref:hypothetical protein n=1 Tax=Bradyrhizobium sp. CCBAU 11445 TaxID=1630896 RepID=UPI00230676E0|nr:hypothetical protein [Bradyrhizobium sp. CCBAU 11445]